MPVRVDARPQKGGKDDAAAIADAGDRRGHGAGVVTALKVSRPRAAPWRPLVFDAAAARVILLLERLAPWPRASSRLPFVRSSWPALAGDGQQHQVRIQVAGKLGR